MTFKLRTNEEQGRLNGYMRRKDVREYVLHAAMHAEPATPEQVRAHLKSATQEEFVLLERIATRAPSTVLRREDLYEDPIVARFVGWVLDKGGRR